MSIKTFALIGKAVFLDWHLGGEHGCCANTLPGPSPALSNFSTALGQRSSVRTQGGWLRQLLGFIQHKTLDLCHNWYHYRVS